jgi:hypothetical protein
MAKKSAKSLKERIDDLANAIGGSTKPAYPNIRSQLFEFSAAVEELENGANIREAEERVAALETALEELKDENAYLDVQLKEANYEIERFREEEKSREEEEADLPEVQFKILKRLPSENGGIAWKLSEISYVAKIPVDEAEIHINRLQNAGLIQKTWGHNESVWYRSIAGSELVLAKRLAGEEEERRPKRYKHADLRKDAQEALLLVARSEEGIEEFELTMRCGKDALYNLSFLCNAQLALSETGIGGLRAPRIFLLARKGAEYLAERGLL